MNIYFLLDTKQQLDLTIEIMQRFYSISLNLTTRKYFPFAENKNYFLSLKEVSSSVDNLESSFAENDFFISIGSKVDTLLPNYWSLPEDFHLGELILMVNKAFNQTKKVVEDYIKIDFDTLTVSDLELPDIYLKLGENLV